MDFRIPAAVFLLAAAGCYAWGLAVGVASGSVLLGLMAVWSAPWGPATLIDLGLCLLLLIAWAWQIERRTWLRLLVTVGCCGLGSVAMLILFAARLPRATSLSAWLMEPLGADKRS